MRLCPLWVVCSCLHGNVLSAFGSMGSSLQFTGSLLSSCECLTRLPSGAHLHWRQKVFPLGAMSLGNISSYCLRGIHFSDSEEPLHHLRQCPLFLGQPKDAVRIAVGNSGCLLICSVSLGVPLKLRWRLLVSYIPGDPL